MSCGQTVCPDNTTGLGAGRALAQGLQPAVDSARCKAGFFAGLLSPLLRQIVQAVGHEEALQLLATCYGAVMHEQNQRRSATTH